MLAKSLREIREKHKLTEEDMADLFFVPVKNIYSWEAGKTLPSIYLLGEISKKFNVEMDVFIKEELSSWSIFKYKAKYISKQIKETYLNNLLVSNYYILAVLMMVVSLVLEAKVSYLIVTTFILLSVLLISLKSSLMFLGIIPMFLVQILRDVTFVFFNDYYNANFLNVTREPIYIYIMFFTYVLIGIYILILYLYNLMKKKTNNLNYLSFFISYVIFFGLFNLFEGLFIFTKTISGVDQIGSYIITVTKTNNYNLYILITFLVATLIDLSQIGIKRIVDKLS